MVQDGYQRIFLSPICFSKTKDIFFWFGTKNVILDTILVVFELPSSYFHQRQTLIVFWSLRSHIDKKFILRTLCPNPYPSLVVRQMSPRIHPLLTPHLFKFTPQKGVSWDLIDILRSPLGDFFINLTSGDATDFKIHGADMKKEAQKTVKMVSGCI